MSIAQIHGYVFGWAIIGSWLLVMVVALILRVARPNGDVPWFWKLVSAAQIILGVQLLYGLFLFLRAWLGDGGLPGIGVFNHVFHPLYGFIFPGVVLFYGHKFSREERLHPLSAFAVVGLVNFGLTFRALMVAAPQFFGG
ncbi:hypothetical protein [Euzebya tangerina]|uniref:hypothetical protein n=1 Tax=Euzebya tangerina TaxID=591198 RepID=UPI000E30C008|nr:hypothetical protein [Euzebya tangerina]